MNKSGFDQQALIDQFANASARQSEQLRKAVYDSAVRALQGRELTLKNIRKVIETVTQAASTGAAQNSKAGPGQIEKLLDSAVTGLDEAMLKAVEANRVALQQLAERGASLRDGQLKQALTELEKMEDTLLATMRKATAGTGETLAGPWQQVFEKFGNSGTQSGAMAAKVSDQLEDQFNRAQSAVRESRATSLKAAQVMASSYTALVSGVLLGLSDALRQESTAAADSEAEAAAPARKAARKKEA